MASLILFNLVNSSFFIHFDIFVSVYPKDSKANFKSSFINKISEFDVLFSLNMLLFSAIVSENSNFFTLSFKSRIIFCAFFIPNPGTFIKILDSFSVTMSIISFVLKVDNIAIASLGPTPLTLIKALKISLSF